MRGKVSRVTCLVNVRYSTVGVGIGAWGERGLGESILHLSSCLDPPATSWYGLHRDRNLSVSHRPTRYRVVVLTSSDRSKSVGHSSRGPMRSVPPRSSGWVGALCSIIKVRRVISLTVQYVVDCSGNALFIPQPSLATFICPGAERVTPQTILSQLPGRVRLERTKHMRRFLVTCRHNRMNVICAHIDCLQVPIPNLARLTNCRFDRFSVPCFQDQRLGL
jgi:hypothetical protein